MSSAISPGSGSRFFARRSSKVGIAVAVLVIVGVYAVHWWRTDRFLEDTDDAYVGGDVTVIGSKVAGYVAQVAVTDNQAVHRGDVVVRIDDRDYRAALAKARASVAEAEAALGNLDAMATLQASVIAQADASTDATRAEARRAEQDDTRYASLSSRSAVSIESAQRARSDALAATAGVKRAEAGATAARGQLDVIKSQMGQARAALLQARAEEDIARLNLSYTELRAPMDGVVGNRRARAGAWSPAGSPLLVIVPAQGLWIDANFKEDQLARMKVGQAVSVRADVLPSRVFRGHVVSLAPATGAQFSVLPPENATGNFTKIVQRVPVRVALDGRDSWLDVLRPGLSVTATIDTRSR